MNDRVERLRERFAESDLGAMLVTGEHNRRYLSGFTGSSGWLLIAPAEAFIATDFRYFEQAQQQCPDFTLYPTNNDLSASLPPLLMEAGLGGQRVAFEAEHMAYSTFRRLREALDALPATLRPQLVPSERMVENLRAVKDAGELATLQRAIDLTDAACNHVREKLAPGLTEMEVAWEFERYVREHGGEGLAFETIVASGPSSAMPHARPTGNPLAEGEPIVIDMGARVDGYCADLTRTFALGRPDERFSAIYDIVLTAQLTAIELIEAGLTGEQAHMLAHRVIEEAGHGERFGHGLGHGAGLEVHEAPRLGRSSSDILADGMVFSIEPGIYITGWGGVRIEDLAVIENGRVRVLSNAPKIGNERV